MVPGADKLPVWTAEGLARRVERSETIEPPTRGFSIGFEGPKFIN